MPFRDHMLFVFLLAFLALCTSIQAAPSPDCLAVQLTPPDSNSGVSTLQFTVTNHCDKDITAYRLVFRDIATGKEILTLSQELLDSLADTPPITDILHPNQSRAFPLDLPVSTVTGSATALIFLDDSTAGQPNDAAALVSNRTRGLVRYEERLKILESVSTWNEALTLHERVDQANAAKSPETSYLQWLSEQFDRSNAASWDAYVDHARKRLSRVIELFRTHVRGASKLR